MKAIVIEKRNGKVVPEYKEISEKGLPAGEVIIDVTHSALNYSDAATMYNIWETVEDFPHIPGIDFIGTVAESKHPDFKRGERVMHTSHGVGYNRWGGLAEKAISNGDWLVRVPDNISSQQAMGLGTVGLTSMLAIHALEANGVVPEDGKILVTGATGGVGSLSIQLLAKLGYTVVASTGKIDESSDYLKKLGANEVISRSVFNEKTDTPMETETYAGFIDCVGGNTLSRAVKQLQYEGVGVATGVVTGVDLDVKLVPFIYRGITLVGINSVYTSKKRRTQAWQHLFELINLETLDAAITVKPLSDVPALAKQTLEGGHEGRIVVSIK
ncbi:MAG: acryloyl-CoA reductase [Bacteroidota bacterium]